MAQGGRFEESRGHEESRGQAGWAVAAVPDGGACTVCVAVARTVDSVAVMLQAFVALCVFQKQCSVPHIQCSQPLAEIFGRLARAENRSAARALFASGGAVARTAYFGQSMNKVEPLGV